MFLLFTSKQVHQYNILNSLGCITKTNIYISQYQSQITIWHTLTKHLCSSSNFDDVKIAW